MRARMVIVLASALFAGFLLATDAQARSDGGRGGGDGFYDNHFSGGTPGYGYGGYGNRSSGLRGEFRGNGGGDVWGHWGAYYGPMIPTI
jgi:hypothetical protein